MDQKFQCIFIGQIFDSRSIIIIDNALYKIRKLTCVKLVYNYNLPLSSHAVPMDGWLVEWMDGVDGLYDYSVDTWSCGCVLAEMLKRRPLFPGEINTVSNDKLILTLNTFM